MENCLECGQSFNHKKECSNNMDITKCTGINCPIKEQCRRFTAKVGINQSYFPKTPIENGKCVMYWGIGNDGILQQLKNIMK
jgi:hypothetical protein